MTIPDGEEYLMGNEHEELVHLEKEMTPAITKLNAFTKQVREDIKRKMISEADGQELILKATIVVNLLTTK